MNGPDQRQQIRTRLRMGLVLVLPGLLLGAVAAKAVEVMVFEHERIIVETESQQLGVSRRQGRRGSVYDRNGAVLAHSAPVRSVWADPSLVEDPVGAARQLAQALDLPDRDARPLALRLSRRHRRFEWIARHVPPEAAKAVEALGFPGVGLRDEHKRYWPHKELAGQVLGFTDLDGHGLAGLERDWEKVLTGKADVVQGYRDARRRLILEDAGGDPVSAGHSLHLTIDAQIQHWMEAELEAAVYEHGARAGVAIALDPRTGDVLGLANAPRFNPNAVHRDPEHERNRAVTDAVEVGSVIKPFTIATAVAGGIASLDSVFDVTGGRYRVAGFTIKDTSRRHKRIALAKCLEVSSNVCLAQLAERIGGPRLDAGLRGFGFGSSTGSGIPGEVSGRMSPGASWSRSRLVTSAYGYGFTATALQVAAAMGAIANGGKLMRPRLVSRVVDGGGRLVHEIPVEERGQAVSPEVARRMRQALARVVEGEDGTAPLAKPRGYRAGGKTGTARKIDPVLGHYVDRFLSTFAGFAPVDDPRIVVVVAIDEPKPAYYAGKVAGPAFARIVERALLHLEVPPDLPDRPEAKIVATKDPNVATAPSPATARAAGGAQGVPDFSGMTLRRALTEAAGAGLVLQPEGSGRAVGQSPAPGSSATPGAACQVRFASAL